MLQKICSKQIFASLQVPFHYLERQQQQARLLDQEHYNPKLKKTWKLSNSVVDQPENPWLLQILSVFFTSNQICTQWILNRYIILHLALTRGVDVIWAFELDLVGLLSFIYFLVTQYV